MEVSSDLGAISLYREVGKGTMPPTVDEKLDPRNSLEDQSQGESHVL